MSSRRPPNSFWFLTKRHAGFAGAHPGNPSVDVPNKIQQQFQVLGDLGFVEFLGRGRSRWYGHAMACPYGSPLGKPRILKVMTALRAASRSAATDASPRAILENLRSDS
jgi:hypothetical protein